MLPTDQIDAFLERATEPLPKTVRLRPECDVPEDWILKPVAEMPEAFFIDRVDRTKALGNSREHFSGEMYIATLSSLLAAKILAPEPGEKVLDVCAAPGSKTTFLAEQMNNEGVLVANELSASRSKKLASNLDRLGCTNTVITQIDGTYMDTFFDQEFDKILLDAPCSSEGAGRKQSEFFEKFWTERKIYEAAKVQKKLIVAAFKMLRPDGEMIYSTCTTAPEENEAVVQHLIDTFGANVEILPIDLGSVPHGTGLKKFFDETYEPDIAKHARRLWPHLHNEQWDSECFFMCKIAKRGGLSRHPAKKARIAAGLNFMRKNQSAEVFSRISKYYDIPKDVWKKYSLLDNGGEIFLCSREVAFFATHNAFRRAGMHIADKHGNPTNAFSMKFGGFANKNIIQLSKEDADKYLEGLDLQQKVPIDLKDGTIVLVREGKRCLGWGKIMQKGCRLKNRLDRGNVS
jgi:16S rRNA (cytosine1407-C5)-methyltransferase